MDRRTAYDRLIDAAPVMRDALTWAIDWIETASHGDNCYVSDHYEGDPGDRCNCGKEHVLDALNDALYQATGEQA